MFKKLLKTLPLSVAAVSAATAGVAVAQEADTGGIGDIVVTAQKREQKLQDVPVAVSALNSTMLEANGITNARGLDSFVPNLAVRNIVGGGKLPSFSMRGINVIGSAAGADRGVAAYVDGVFQGAASGSNFDLADLERVEVLRGPQGTLFGRNSTGGAISWYTKDPTGEFGVDQKFTIGNYEQLAYKTSVNLPEFYGFSASLSYGHTERQGDIRNLGAGTVWDFTPVGLGKRVSPKYLGDDDTDTFAAAVKWEPTDDIKLVYKFDLSESDYTTDGMGIGYAQPALLSFMADQPAGGQRLTPISATRPEAVNNWNTTPSWLKVWGHNLTATWNISDSWSVKSITSMRRTELDGTTWSNIDGLGGLVVPTAPSAMTRGFISIFGAGGTNRGLPAFPNPGNLYAVYGGQPFLFTATSTGGKETQKSEEIQFNYESDSQTLTFGAIYFENVINKGKGGALEEISNSNPLTPFGQPNSQSYRVYPNFVVPDVPGAFTPGGQPTTYGGRNTWLKVASVAAYVQDEIHVTPKLDLVLGARYTRDKKTGIDNYLVNSTSTTVVLPPVKVNYQLSRPTYNIGVNYKVTPSILTYGKYSTGFISGGVVSTTAFQPETIESFEAGVKADWFGRRLRTNLALFNSAITNLQLTTSGRNVPSCVGRPCQSSAQVIVNPGDASAKGFELETTWLPLDELTLTANVGYTDFKFTRLGTVFGTDTVLPVQRPDWTFSTSADYMSKPLFADTTFSARIDANWRSDVFMSNIPGLGSFGNGTWDTLAGATAARNAFIKSNKVEGYWIANTRFGLNDIKIGGTNINVAGWVRNIFDEDTISYSPGIVIAQPASYERARTYGIDVNVKF